MSDKTIHNGHRHRLREKFIKHNDSFSDHELLELLLTYAIPRVDTNKTAHKLIDAFGSLQAVISADPKVLTTVDGVGDSAAYFLSLVGKVSETTRSVGPKKKTFGSIEDAKKYLAEEFTHYDCEVFFVIYLNSRDKVIKIDKIDNDSKSSVAINTKSLLQGIMINKPYAIIIAHNHFAEFPYPSKDDDDATAKIYLMASFNKVMLYDHLIFGGKSCFSYFYDNRLQEIKSSIDDALRNGSYRD